MSSSSASSSSDSERSTAVSHPRKKPRVSTEPSDDSSDPESTDSDEATSSDADTDEEEDVPVLSHADKRRQKKKEQRQSREDDVAADGPSKKGKGKVQNTADLPPSKIPRRQNSIWVGNLSFKTTPESLKTFFEGVGEITRVHMPTKMTTGGREGGGARKENRGFAYVDFATPDAKTVAITMSENPLDGRRLLIKDGSDFNGRPAAVAAPAAEGEEAPATSKTTGHTKTAQKILRVQKQPPGPTLFLGNLGFETTEDAIRELLESHRAKDAAADAADKWMRKIRLGTFEDSGKCKGWAFVDFTTAEHATAALTNPRNHHLNGRKLVVEYASPDAVRRGGGGPPRERPAKEGKAAYTGEKGGKRERPPHRARWGDAAAGGDEGEGEELGPPAKRQRADGGEDDGSAKRAWGKGGRDGAKGGKPVRRAKPGAALALAKREDVAIVPSQGTKIVF